MSNGLKTLLISVAAVVTVATISFLFLSTRAGKEFVNDTVPKLFQHSDKDTSGIYEAYDGTTIFGTDVIAAVDKYGETITIKITLGDGTTVTDLSKITDASGEFYVNPMGTFLASLEYDDDGSTVIALLFNQVVDKVSKPTAVPAPPSTQVEIKENYELDHIECTNPTMYTLEGADDFNRYGMTLKAYFTSNSGESKVVDFATSDLIAAGKYHNVTYEKGTYHDNLVSDYDKTKFLLRAGEEDSEYNLMVSFTYNGRTAHTRIKIMITTPIEYNLASACGEDCGLCLTDTKDYTAYAGHPMDLTTNKIQTGNGASIKISVPKENTTLTDDMSSDDHTHRTKTQTNTNATVKYEISRYITDEYYTFNVSVLEFKCIEQNNETSGGPIAANSHWIAEGDEFKLRFNTMCNFSISDHGTDTGKGKDAREIVVLSKGGSDTSTVKCKVTATDKISKFKVEAEHRVWAPLAVVHSVYEFDYKKSSTLTTDANTKQVEYSTSNKDWFTLEKSGATAANSANTMKSSKSSGATDYNKDKLELIQEFTNFGNRKLYSEVKMFATLSIKLSCNGTKTYGCKNVWTAVRTGGYGDLTYSWTFADTGTKRKVQNNEKLIDRAVAFVLGEPTTANADGESYTIDKLVVGMEDDTVKCTVTDKLNNNGSDSSTYGSINPSYSFKLERVCTCSTSKNVVAGHPLKANLEYANSGSGGNFNVSSSGTSLKYGTKSSETNGYTDGVAGITKSLTSGTSYYVTSKSNTTGTSTTASITVERTDTGESYSSSTVFRQFTGYIMTSDYKKAGTVTDDGSENDSDDNDDGSSDEITNVPGRITNYIMNTRFKVHLRSNSHNVAATLYDWKTHVDGNDSKVISNKSKMTEAASGTITSESGSVSYSTSNSSFKLGEYYESSVGACKSSDDKITRSNKYSDSVVCTCTTKHTITNGAYNSDYVWGQNNSWQTVPNNTVHTCTLSEGVWTAIFTDPTSGFTIVRRMPAGTQSVNLALNYSSDGGAEDYSNTIQYATGVNHGIDVDKFSTEDGKTKAGRYGWIDAVTALTGDYKDPDSAISGRVRYFTPCDGIDVSIVESTSGDSAHTCGNKGYALKKSKHAKIDQTTNTDSADRLSNYSLNINVYYQDVNSSNSAVKKTLSRNVTYIRFNVTHDAFTSFGDNNHYECRLFNNFGCDEALGKNNFRFDRVKITFKNYCRPDVYTYTRGADN